MGAEIRVIHSGDQLIQRARRLGACRSVGHEPAPYSSQGVLRLRWPPSQAPVCGICSNPNRARWRSCGLFCCDNCNHFIKRTIHVGARYKCAQRSGHSCRVQWSPHKHFLCSACRWKKIMKQPDFFHVHEQLGRVPISASQSDLHCALCESVHGVTRSEYGPLCCRNCLVFIERTKNRRNEFHCEHASTTMTVRLRGPHRFISCNSCAWLKITSNPDFKLPPPPSSASSASSSTSLKSPPASKPTLANPAKVPSSESSATSVLVRGQRQTACDVCSNTNSIFASQRFNRKLCVPCLKFIKDTEDYNRSYACPAGGGCDITWELGKDLCGACRLEAIVCGADTRTRLKFRLVQGKRGQLW